MGRPTVIDWFCGAGGASIGLERAGFDVVLAIDLNQAALATHLRGLPHVRVRCDDVNRRMPDEINPFTDYARPALAELIGRVDGWWTSPPCQPFSAAGKRLGGDDARDGWPAMVDLLRECTALGTAPRWIVAENVAGMVDRRGRPYLDRLVSQLRELGPVDYRVLDAADYGVPQRRRRIILRWGEATNWGWAPPTHADPALNHPYRKDWVTMAEALPHLGMEAPSPTISTADGQGLGSAKARDTLQRHTISIVGGGLNPHFPGEARRERDLSNEPSTTICGPSGNQIPSVVLTGHRTSGKDGDRPLHQATTDEPAPTLRDGHGTAGLSIAKPDWFHRSNHPEEVSRTIGTKRNSQVSLNRPSPCVSATEEKGAGNRAQRAARGEDMGSFGMDRASDLALLAAGRRRLTHLECATLQGFPDDYPWSGSSKSDYYRQIGNACPPALTAAVMCMGHLSVVRPQIEAKACKSCEKEDEKPLSCPRSSQKTRRCETEEEAEKRHRLEHPDLWESYDRQVWTNAHQSEG